MSGDIVTTRIAGGVGSAQRLWDALRCARAEQKPRTLAQVEDALFRHYLPMARSTARGHSSDGADLDARGQVAEVGLAQAILAWRRPDADGFDRFARAAITDHLRRHDWLTRGPRGAIPGVPGQGVVVTDPGPRAGR